MAIARSKPALTTTLTTAKSTAKNKGAKAGKKAPTDFPLTPHKHSNRWCKKIKGKMFYFGPWNDGDPRAAQAALEKWLDQKDDLLAGRTPRVKTEGFTVKDLCNRFLTTKRHLVDTGEITSRTFADYHSTCLRIAETFGKNRVVIDLAADDFERLRKQFAKTRGPVALGNEVQRVRTVFKYAYDQGLIAAPIRYGQSFQKPSAKTLRIHRHAKGPRMFEAPELRQLIAAAGVPLKAMILLGINGGFGNADCATLPRSAIDLDRGWLNYARPKTGIARRCPLWPETVSALRAATDKRPSANGDTDDALAFITKYGASWSKAPEVGGGDAAAATVVDNPLTKEFRKLLGKLNLHRPGLGFYALRHTFETIGGESRDQIAVTAIMGHAPPSNDMSAVYRERISDDRLKAVVNYVRNWLLTDGRGDEPMPPPSRCGFTE